MHGTNPTQHWFNAFAEGLSSEACGAQEPWRVPLNGIAGADMFVWCNQEGEHFIAFLGRGASSCHLQPQTVLLCPSELGNALRGPPTSLVQAWAKSIFRQYGRTHCYKTHGVTVLLRNDVYSHKEQMQSWQGFVYNLFIDIDSFH